MTADRIKAIVLAGSTSGEGSLKVLMSSDEDEGNPHCVRSFA